MPVLMTVKSPNSFRDERSSHANPLDALPTRELVFSFASMAILSIVVSLNFIPIGEQANRNLQRAEIDRVTQALDSYKSCIGSYPTQEEGLVVLWDQTAVIDVHLSDWSGPYLSGPVTDRWGAPIVYQWPSALVTSDRESTFDLHSPGPDGLINTSDDITNHDHNGIVEAHDPVVPSIFSSSSEAVDAS